MMIINNFFNELNGIATLFVTDLPKNIHYSERIRRKKNNKLNATSKLRGIKARVYF